MVHVTTHLLMGGWMLTVWLADFFYQNSYPIERLLWMYAGFVAYNYIFHVLIRHRTNPMPYFTCRQILNLFFITLLSGMTGGLYSGGVFLLLANVLTAIFVLPINWILMHSILIIFCVTLLALFHYPLVHDMLALPAYTYQPIVQNYGHWISTQTTFVLAALFSIYLVFYLTKKITDEKKYIEHLSEELETRNKELNFKNTNLEHFNYLISHQLKNPLTTISVMSATLLEIANSPDTEELELIQKSSEIMHRTINELFLLAKLSKEEVTLQPVKFSDLVQQTVQELQHELSLHQATLDIRPLPYLPANEAWMREVFKNLILNALKYNDNKQPVIEIGTLAKGKGMYVRDNGIGISVEHQDKIFDMFYRAPNALQTDGTGVGLYLVKKIMEFHHGRISVDSQLGKGTTVYLFFDGDTAG